MPPAAEASASLLPTRRGGAVVTAVAAACCRVRPLPSLLTLRVRRLKVLLRLRWMLLLQGARGQGLSGERSAGERQQHRNTAQQRHSLESLIVAAAGPA